MTALADRWAAAGCVLVVGDVVTDVAVVPQATVTVDSDTPSRITTGTGGAGANIASWLARSGAQVRLVGRVGDDVWGPHHAARLSDRGIEARLRVDTAAPTGTVVVLVQADRRTMFPDRGANALLRDDDVGTAELDSVSHLHLSGYALLDERSRPAALGVLAAATAACCRLSLDASSVGPLRAAGCERFLEWTAGAALVHANLDEAVALSGAREPDTAALRLGGRYGEVVVTCGSGPAVWSDGNDVIRAEAEPVEVRDPTGAGDAFTGAFLAARLAGGSPATALRSGHRAGAWTVARDGPFPG